MTYTYILVSMSHVLARAVDRGEIEASAITEDLWDMTPSIAALLGRWFWWPVRVRQRPIPQKFGEETTRQLSLF